MIIKKYGPRESYCDKRRVVETEKGFQRKILSQKVLYVATPKESNSGRNR